MIDIGVNLTNPQFRADIDAVLARAIEAGLTHLVLTGTDLDASHQALQLCDQYADQYPNFLFATAGVHPHDARHWNAQVAQGIGQLLQHPKLVAAGEMGLDFNRNFSEPQTQIATLHAQIELAIEYGKPLFLHERDAFAEQYAILQQYGSDLPPAVIHCFTGTLDALHAYLELGCYIGITGWVCDERRGKPLQACVPHIPLDRLMVETDAPYLLPRTIHPKPKSRRNEPAYLPWVVATLADCMQQTPDTILRHTTENALRFFHLPRCAANDGKKIVSPVAQ